MAEPHPPQHDPPQDPQSRLTPTLDPASVPVDMGAPFDGSKPSARKTAVPLEDRPPPEQVGPYKCLQVIGEGGFGTVWIADQISPVKRRVALKIIKLGMD